VVVVEPERVDVDVGGSDAGYDGRGSSATHDYSCLPSSSVDRSTFQPLGLATRSTLLGSLTERPTLL